MDLGLMEFDVVVIGGGPGGYVSAIRAAQLGLKVAIVEMERMGGTCLNKGCIPTKALLQSAKVKNIVEHASNFGIITKLEAIDFKRVVERAVGVVNDLNNGVSGLVKKNKITLINGEAKFISANKLIVDGKTEVLAKNIIIATGAKPRLIPGISEDLLKKGLVWTSKEAMFASRLPEKMLILGTGAIGIEFASFYNSLGAEVTVLEIQDRILIQEDEEIATSALKAFQKKGIKFLLKTSATNFREKDGKLSVDINGISETFDVCIVAIGVVPNTNNLTLEKIGLKTEVNGSIKVNERMETSVSGVYAIGDITLSPWLAHKASREGIICAEKIANVSQMPPLNYGAIPNCTYSNPQIASIGLTEQKAKEKGLDVKIGRSHFRGNGKALAVGESDGFVKVIFDSKTGELLGAHMIGYDVTELIPIFSVAITAELTEKELMTTVFPHPTMSECVQEAVMQAFGVNIH